MFETASVGEALPGMLATMDSVPSTTKNKLKKKKKLLFAGKSLSR